MVFGNFQNFPENLGFLNDFDFPKNNVNLILFSWEIIDGNVFFKIRPKESYIWYDFISEMSKLLKFMIFQKLVKIDLFNQKQT